jgi:hypothetical protein
MAIATLDTINSTLLGIKSDSKSMLKFMVSKKTSAANARSSLKPRSAAPPKALIQKPNVPAKSKGSGTTVGGLLASILGKGLDWFKWFAAIGLGLMFKTEISDFISGAFEPLKKMVVKWWDDKFVPAIGDLGKLALGEDFYKYLFGTTDKPGAFKKGWEGVKSLGVTIGNWATDLDKWSKDNMGFSFLDPILGTMKKNDAGVEERIGGIFGKDGYFSKLGEGIKAFGTAIGVTDADGNATTFGLVGLAGTIATLITFFGVTSLLKLPATLLKLGFKTFFGVLGGAANLLGTLSLFLGGMVVKGLAYTFGGVLLGAAEGLFLLSNKFKPGGVFSKLSGAAALQLANLSSLVTPTAKAGAAPAAIPKAAAKGGSTIGKIGKTVGRLAPLAAGASLAATITALAPIVIGVLAVAAVAGAAYLIYKHIDDKKTAAQGMAISALKHGGLYSDEQKKFAEAEARKKVDNKRSITKFGSKTHDDEDKGTYAEFVAADPGRVAAAKELAANPNNTGVGKKIAQEKAEYEKGNQEYRADIEYEKNETLSTVVMWRQQEQRKAMMALFNPYGPLRDAFKNGAIGFGPTLTSEDLMTNVEEWIANPKNAGMPINRKTLTQLGLVIDPEKKFSIGDPNKKEGTRGARREGAQLDQGGGLVEMYHRMELNRSKATKKIILMDQFNQPKPEISAGQKISAVADKSATKVAMVNGAGDSNVVPPVVINKRDGDVNVVNNNTPAGGGGTGVAVVPINTGAGTGQGHKVFYGAQSLIG